MGRRSLQTTTKRRERASQPASAALAIAAPAGPRVPLIPKFDDFWAAEAARLRACLLEIHPDEKAAAEAVCEAFNWHCPFSCYDMGARYLQQIRDRIAEHQIDQDVSLELNEELGQVIPLCTLIWRSQLITTMAAQRMPTERARSLSDRFEQFAREVYWSLPSSRLGIDPTFPHFRIPPQPGQVPFDYWQFRMDWQDLKDEWKAVKTSTTREPLLSVEPVRTSARKPASPTPYWKKVFDAVPHGKTAAIRCVDIENHSNLAAMGDGSVRRILRQMQKAHYVFQTKNRLYYRTASTPPWLSD